MYTQIENIKDKKNSTVRNTVTMKNMEYSCQQFPTMKHGQLGSQALTHGGVIIQRRMVHRYFTGIKTAVADVGTGNNTKPYNYSMSELEKSFGDDQLGDDGFSTFIAGKSGQREQQPYRVDLEMEEPADNFGPLKKNDKWFGHKTTIIQDGHWSLNGDDDPANDEGKSAKKGTEVMTELKDIAKDDVKRNPEFGGTRHIQDPKNLKKYVSKTKGEITLA